MVQFTKNVKVNVLCRLSEFDKPSSSEEDKSNEPADLKRKYKDGVFAQIELLLYHLPGITESQQI
jgi:hypothetical protein